MENCQYFDAINVYYFVNTKIDAFWLKLQIEQNINLTHQSIFQFYVADTFL